MHEVADFKAHNPDPHSDGITYMLAATHRSDSDRYETTRKRPCDRQLTALHVELFNSLRPGGETGRRTGLKIPGPERDVPVQFRSRAPSNLFIRDYLQTVAGGDDPERSTSSLPRDDLRSTSDRCLASLMIRDAGWPGTGFAISGPDR
jgi:hypothetical protein